MHSVIIHQLLSAVGSAPALDSFTECLVSARPPERDLCDNGVIAGVNVPRGDNSVDTRRMIPSVGVYNSIVGQSG